MKKRIIVCFIFIHVLIVFGVAKVEDQVFTLEDALKYAYTHNFDIIVSRKNIEIAKAQCNKSKRFSNPELEFEISKIPKDLGKENITDVNVREGVLRISQPFTMWGKRRLNILVSKNESKQIEYELEILWLDIVRLIKNQYTQTVLFQRSIELAQDTLKLRERLLEKTKMKFYSGKARNHELSRSKLEVANARNDVLKAQNDFNIAIGELNVLLGRSMGKNIKLEDNLEPKDIKYDLQELINLALKNRIEILSVKEEIVKKKRELSLTKRQRLPDFNIGVFVEKEEGIYNAGAGISFEIPLWDFYGNDIKKAIVEKEIAQINLEAVKKRVELDVYIAFKNVELSKRVVANLKESIKQGNELLRILTIDYSAGKINFLQYLEGLTSHKEIRQKYLQALVNYSDKLALLEQVVGLNKGGNE